MSKELSEPSKATLVVPRCPICGEEIRLVAVSENGWFEDGGRIPVTAYYWACGCTHTEKEVYYNAFFRME